MKISILLCLASFMISPAYAANEPSLEDLGFSKKTTQGNPQLQTDLETREHKLQTHQVTGLITLGLMAADLATAGMVKHNNVHQFLGGFTFATYWTTFYLSASAPKPADVQDKGMNIKIHKILQWVTAPLMIATPIAGIIASNQLHNGGHTHGIGSYKSPLAAVTIATYTASIAVMAFEF
jgi:hypothetical protein